jgi:hypothetical protein
MDESPSLAANKFVGNKFVIQIAPSPCQQKITAKLLATDSLVYEGKKAWASERLKYGNLPLILNK